MKRFVYVPVGMAKDGIPEFAKKMANESKLSIRVGEPNDGVFVNTIEIISTPEKVNIEYKSFVSAGFIYSVDITNEFVSFDKSVFLEVEDEQKIKTFKPRLREKHLLRFRIRLLTPGKKMFLICSEDGTKYHKGFFEVV